jgi:hypothetical protein
MAIQNLLSVVPPTRSKRTVSGRGPPKWRGRKASTPIASNACENVSFREVIALEQHVHAFGKSDRGTIPKVSQVSLQSNGYVEWRR